ncbi:hypothetical protein ACD591_09005 [Rufibacter glacialis]|uniref:Uncharacterized protein n=1 Tax=Rufibacter glacialis TaxID=1259555 RepID=A0A5M8QC82_9BACT|nr:hypothetical protein [Rufibacter glacialis]KAA6432426.1 hypothetical protein FOE74_15105 [Rufibacter glacialis]GGK78573.1 hypothetical protein GCM10011405_28050 [Rufibacter glacialis]
MKVIGNVLDITPQRDSRHQGVEVHLDTVEYLTSKKDGRYYQDFEYEVELETPLVLTGDCLARTDARKPKDGEYEFKVFDKVGEEYVLNPDKKLYLTLEYDFDDDVTILSSAYYSVTLSNEEFTKFKTEQEKEKSRKNWKGRKKS